MKQMEGRSRVSLILNSQAFKEELEHIIHEQMRHGGPASLLAMQHISDFLLSNSKGNAFGKSEMLDDVFILNVMLLVDNLMCFYLHQVFFISFILLFL